MSHYEIKNGNMKYVSNEKEIMWRMLIACAAFIIGLALGHVWSIGQL
jgi:hypothetical protein